MSGAKRLRALGEKEKKNLTFYHDGKGRLRVRYKKRRAAKDVTDYLQFGLFSVDEIAAMGGNEFVGETVRHWANTGRKGHVLYPVEGLDEPLFSAPMVARFAHTQAAGYEENVREYLDEEAKREKARCFSRTQRAFAQKKQAQRFRMLGTAFDKVTEHVEKKGGRDLLLRARLHSAWAGEGFSSGCLGRRRRAAVPF